MVDSSPAEYRSKDLMRRAAKGVLWLFGKTAVVTIMKLVFLMVLARLLTPEEFGLVAMAAVIGALVTNIARLGVSPAIVQLPALSIGHRVAGVHIGVVLGTVAALAVYSLAEPVARSVDMEGLAPLLRMVAVVPLIASLGQVPEGMMERDLRFKELALIDGGSYVVSQAIVAVPLAVYGLGATALVWGMIAAATVKTLSEMARSHLPMALSAPVCCYVDILRFGTGVSLASISQTIAYNIDNFVIGKFLGAEALGIYSRAFQVLTMPTKLFGAALSKVLFPAMAAVKDDRDRLSRSFLQSLGVTAMVSLPATAFLLVAAPEIVWVVLGPQWGDLIVPFQLLALAIMMRVGNKVCDSLIRATGAVYGLAWRQGLYAALVFAGAYSGHFFGLNGAALGVALAITLNFLIMVAFSVKLAGATHGAATRTILRHLVISASFAVFLWVVIEYLRAEALHPLVTLGAIAVLTIGIVLATVNLAPQVLGSDGRLLRKVVGKLTPVRERPV